MTPPHRSPAQSRNAELAAQWLLEIGAILFRPEPPFIFTSGWASPVYTDMRKVIAFPRTRSALVSAAAEIIRENIGCESLDVIAGGETAGIPYAAWLATELALPMQYVRKKPKGFGRNARIEGEVRDGARVLLVEDLATDGRSKVNFVEAIRESGQICADALVFFYYGIFAEAEADLQQHGIRLHALTTWHDVLKVAKAKGTFAKPVLAEVERFLAEPAAWSAAHGGVSSFKAGG
ncbi:MAG: orotate phosphoribosyltransferase [Hyphomicrobiales bacterium]|nr:orotate phosphoribosyltransferase [Hyphomicrobiales bacterium]